MTKPKVVRLWWRCTLCRFRFDTFGLSHDDPEDRTAMADYAMPHVEGRHGFRPETYSEAAAYFFADGATSRVVRHSVIVETMA